MFFCRFYDVMSFADSFTAFVNYGFSFFFDGSVYQCFILTFNYIRLYLDPCLFYIVLFSFGVIFSFIRFSDILLLSSVRRFMLNCVTNKCGCIFCISASSHYMHTTRPCCISTFANLNVQTLIGFDCFDYDVIFSYKL